MKKSRPADVPPRDTLLEMYRLLRLTRAMDERAQALYRQGRIRGGVYSSRGQEAISIGTSFALRRGDYVSPMIRNMGTVLARGHTPREVMANYFARATAPTKGKDNSQHFGDVEGTGVISYISMLGCGVPVMAGMALGAKLKGEKRVGLTYVGDGATSTGDFYEGLNLAAVLRLPLVVVIENNGFAYSTAASKQSLLKDLADKAKAFGIPGATGDGNDVVDVWRRTGEAVEAARAGEGPRLLEFRTFRMSGHATHDGADYVPRELLERWAKRDPIARCERVLRPTREERARVEASVTAAVDDAVAFAESSPAPDPADARRGVFGDDAITDLEPGWRRWGS